MPGGVGQQKAPSIVGRDQIAGPCDDAPDRIRRRGFEINPFVSVAQCQGAGYICADLIALDDVSGSAGPNEVDASLSVGVAVAGDQVAGDRAGAADGIAGGAGNAHSRPSVRQAARPAGSSPNEVALDEVVCGGGPIQEDAVLAIAGNQVASATRGAANNVSRRLDVDPAK